MICKNCGFKNQEGDEFCGSCGQYLEFAGVKTEDTEAAAAAVPPDSAPPLPPDDQTMAMPTAPAQAPPPPMQAAPPPPMQAAPPPPPPGPPPTSQFSGRSPDIICWNCGRRNPAGRTFCIQCGEKLTTGKTTPVKAAGVTAAAPVGGLPPAGGGGADNRRMVAIAVGLVVVLVVVLVVGAAAFLGNNNPQPTGTPIANGPTPTATAIASNSAIPTGTAPITPGPTPTDTGLVTPTPTDVVTPTPPPVTPTPHVTAAPGALCAKSTKVRLNWTFKGNGAKETLDSHTAWCVNKVTFTMTSGVGLLKIYLINDKFSPSQYGWLEANYPSDFQGSNSLVINKADFGISLPSGFDSIPPNTTILFKVTCQSGSCSGATVKLGVDPKSV